MPQHPAAAPQPPHALADAVVPPRQCGRCRGMFEGVPTVAPAIPDWWLCDDCQGNCSRDRRHGTAFSAWREPSRPRSATVEAGYPVTARRGPTKAAGTDEVRVALDALLVVLRESTQRNQVATRRAQTIRRLRSHGRSYGEILGRVAGSLTLGITRKNLDCLIEASDQLHRAEVRALHDEGVALADIAILCGITQKRASTLLAIGA